MTAESRHQNKRRFKKKKSFKHTRRAETVLKWVLVCFKGILDKSVFTLLFLNDCINNVNENITDHYWRNVCPRNILIGSDM